MKKNALFLLASIVFLTSCSSDNDSASDSGLNPSGNDYFPLAINNYWTYNINSPSATGRDSLYIANDTVINAKTYKKFKTRVPVLGSISTTVGNNGLRKDNGKLLMSGLIGFEIVEDLPFLVTLNDFVVFKDNAANNEQLASISETLQRQYAGYPLTFTYTLKTIAAATLPTYTSNNITYTDVKPVKTILSLKMDSMLLGSAVPVMENQDVVVSTQYYAKDMGIIHATTTISYQLNPQIATILQIPQTYNETQQESLDTYHFVQ